MFRVLKLSALALLLSMVPAIHVSAATITDPIVRTKAGPGASIPINSLPFFFNWGSFPDVPAGFEADCFSGFEGSLALVSCEFANNTGQNIGFLDFNFDYTNAVSGPPDVSEFFTEDPNEFWDDRTIDQFSAQFVGGGIPAFQCTGEIEPICVPFVFIVDLVGFPEGTNITMVAAASEVPEPMTLSLVGTGLAIAALRRRRRK